MDAVQSRLLLLTGIFLVVRLAMFVPGLLPEKTRVRAGDLATAGICASLISMALLMFVFRVSVVDGESMSPSLEDGYYSIVDRLIYHLHEPQRGDIIVFQSPVEPGRDYIKRIVGLPGETVAVRHGWVTVNGIKLVEPYEHDPPDYFAAPVRVRPNHVYVLGDNRQVSSDSHVWGPIAYSSILGKCSVVIWPLSAVGMIRGMPQARWTL